MKSPGKSNFSPKLCSYFLMVVISSRICQGRDLTVKYEFGCTWTSNGILLCRCQEGAQELYLQKEDVPSINTYGVSISDCNSVRFGKDVLSPSRNLRTVDLANIPNLVFEENSISWDGYARDAILEDETIDRTMPGLRITVRNSTVHEISRYAFKGRLNEINFQNTVIEKISPYAFTSLLQSVRLQFTSCVFKNISFQAFKKFSTGNLLLDGCDFGNVPSRTFSDIKISESLSITNCKFSRINPSAFIVENPRNFDIINSRFDILDGDAFKVMTTGGVLIKDSFFNVTHAGAFMGIKLNPEIVVMQKFIFDNDTFNTLQGDSLAIDSKGFEAVYNKITLNQECDCWYIDRVLESDTSYREFKCLLQDGELISLKDFKNFSCSVISSMTLIIIVSCVVLILIIILVSVVIVYFKRVFRGSKQKEYINDKNGKPLSVIMPDGRTYKETELHVIVERADLLTTDF